MSEHDRLEEIKSLVSLFAAHIDQYKSSQYDEANARADFIDKFFALLDWDMANNQGFSESCRDVVREDKVKIDGSQKAPDYSFRIGGARKFFVEAKKPRVNIKDAIEPAYQVRRYAYTARLPLSILTNFAEFAVYDTRIKPHKDDKSSAARIFYCAFDQYEQHFDFIYNTFSKNAILKGGFDKYIETNKNKKGASEVDTELLNLLEEWRVELAKNIAKNNPALSIYNLNTVTQKIIDRIVFLRIAEDKGIEDESLLLTAAKTTNVYKKLILLFERANAKYNSGLFSPVDWIDNFRVDDNTLSNIIINLYYPECPYEFSVLPVEILGSIYERFLGKTIRFRAVKGDTHTAVIEEKPEVKKAGGVFYTPQYIVDYIIENTVGKKIKDKTPLEIAAIKICDPACGSGSFLVGAYQFLLNYHLDYYTQPKNIKAAIRNEKMYEAAFKSYKLTINEKQRILTNSIFGVDIDSQAVEVIKLSLYLKLLENEGREADGRLFKHSDMALLPSLEDNIKCGNSLIGTDFYAQGNLDLTDDDRIKVNCFDWEKEFPSIFKGGGMDAGFDAVIGNPPYVLAQTMDDKAQFAYLSRNYESAAYKIDTYQVFLEKALKIARTGGFIGFITPNTFLRNKYSLNIRSILLKQSYICSLRLFYYPVFPAASVDTLIICARKTDVEKENHIVEIAKCIQMDKEPQIIHFPQKEWLKNNNYEIEIIDTMQSIAISKKIQANSKPFGSLGTAYFGIQTHNREKYVSLVQKNKDWKPVIDGKNIHNFFFDAPSEYVCCDKKAIKSGGNDNVYKKERICTRQIGETPVAAIVQGGIYTLNTVYNLFFDKETDYSIKFVLGIMMSSAFKFYWKMKYFDEKKTFPKIKKDALMDMPIPALDLSIKAGKAARDNLVSLVDKILELKQKEAAGPNQRVKAMIARQIEGADRALDAAAYGLYGLDEEEIKAAEEKE
jgi:type I restriction-modification system DNA methylase subunit